MSSEYSEIQHVSEDQLVPVMPRRFKFWNFDSETSFKGSDSDQIRFRSVRIRFSSV